MGGSDKLNGIRVANRPTTQQTFFSIIYAVFIGVILGLAAKLVDTPGINPVFDDMGGRLGIWVFVATLLSVFSYSPKVAAVKAFAFFGSMLTVYYVYTVLFLHFIPVRAILFWGLCAVISPICAYIIWYAHGNGLFSCMVSSLPITMLLIEGFELRNAYLPIHTHYYLIPVLMGVYLIMIIVLLLFIPKNKMQLLSILPIALILSIILIYFNVLGRIFGGMNGVL
ncbi:hypothetical protein [Paenibacillus xylanilyticus]|uniref:Uncharacterized protein n=1 Tax=Paenibacillus xylanilyticus TaxID=248903 RepID=A0A7Y6C2Y7_9BACL|nr:hypothetical protein [Paenibacillus xylanilyticus]NUU79667.1 hypothetical protein [Paenibacillus xylanilyticus]